jgi:hypothetical protein
MIFIALSGNVFQRRAFISCHPHVFAGWWPTHTNLLVYLPSLDTLIIERERERELGVVLRDTTVVGRGSETIMFGLKVPRHCPLVLLIRVRLEFRVN